MGLRVALSGRPRLLDVPSSIFDGIPSIFDGNPSIFDGNPSIFDGGPSIFDGPVDRPTIQFEAALTKYRGAYTGTPRGSPLSL